MIVACFISLTATQEAIGHRTLPIRSLVVPFLDDVGSVPDIGKQSIAINQKNSLIVFPHQKYNSFNIVNLKTDKGYVIAPDWKSIITKAREENSSLLECPLFWGSGIHYSGAIWSPTNKLAVHFAGVPSYVLLYDVTNSDDNSMNDISFQPLQHTKTIASKDEIFSLSFSPTDGRLLLLGTIASIFFNNDHIELHNNLSGTLRFLRILDTQKNYQDVFNQQIEPGNVLINAAVLLAKLSNRPPQENVNKTDGTQLQGYLSSLFIAAKDITFFNDNTSIGALLSIYGTLRRQDPSLSFKSPLEIMSNQYVVFRHHEGDYVSCKTILVDSPFITPMLKSVLPFTPQRHYIDHRISNHDNDVLIYQKWQNTVWSDKNSLTTEVCTLCNNILKDIKQSNEYDQKILDARLLIDGSRAILEYRPKDGRHTLYISYKNHENGYSEIYLLPPSIADVKQRKSYNYKQCITSMNNGKEIILVRENSQTGQEEMLFINRASCNQIFS